MKNLLISCFCIVFLSCSFQKSNFLLSQKKTVSVIENKYFSNIDEDYVYKAKINVYKHKFGGILVLKKIKNNHTRVVFMTEFGNKIFDFELIEDKLKINFIFDELNKSIIVKALHKDYLLLSKQLITTEQQFLSNKEDVYQSNFNNQNNYYYFNINDELYKVVMASKQKEKVSIFYNDFEKSIAKNIDIIHKNIKLTIHLNYIGN